MFSRNVSTGFHVSIPSSVLSTIQSSSGRVDKGIAQLLDEDGMDGCRGWDHSRCSGNIRCRSRIIRCGTRPCTDVGEERCETNRAVSSVLEVIMYSSNNMISRYTELKPKSRGKRSVMEKRTTNIAIWKEEKQGRQKKPKTGVEDIITSAFFFPHRRERLQDLFQRLITRPL